MLLPTISVTAIGLLVGIAGVLAIRGRPGATLAHAVIGAWCGFVIGALVGVLIDVMLGNGIYLGIVGHAVALAGAVVAVGRLRRSRQA